MQEELQEEAQSEQASPVVEQETVTLRHPHTHDTKVVAAKPEDLIPLMGRGYCQVKGA